MKMFFSKNRTVFKESVLLQEEDILSDLTGNKGSCLFLGRYALAQVEAVLRKRNFYKDAKKKKLWPLKFHMDYSEFPLQRFQIFFQKEDLQNIVVDLKIREGTFQPKQKLSSVLPLPSFRFLILDWLTLQNPLQEFSDERIPLPGQKHPGLNLGKKVLDIFVYLARINRLDGLLAYPAYYHNALLFCRYFQFLNPEKQAEVLAIQKALKKIPFKELAWIVHLDCLRDQDNNTYKWEAEELVVPLNKTLKMYMNSREYDKKVKQNMKKIQFTVDWDCYRKKRNDETQIP
ncbi:MAG: hypothetical protein JSV17_14900 [Candidatus Aminicenantes bacterium]|nr:MAG: hypothetical protein JSV17_14900 [Candidatus Aminicenantes bacterium]